MLEQLLAFMNKGGPVAWVIVGFSVVVTTLIIERWRVLKRAKPGKDFFNQFFRLEQEHRFDEAVRLCQKNDAPCSRILLTCLESREMPKELIRERVAEVMLNETPGLSRYISTISIIATLLPILGLLGTVTGMIKIFDVLSRLGVADPNALAGGISEALITTELGLITAIPTLICHNILTSKVDNLIAEIEHSVAKFLNIMAGR